MVMNFFANLKKKNVLQSFLNQVIVKQENIVTKNNMNVLGNGGGILIYFR